MVNVPNKSKSRPTSCSKACNASNMAGPVCGTRCGGPCCQFTGGEHLTSVKDCLRIPAKRVHLGSPRNIQTARRTSRLRAQVPCGQRAAHTFAQPPSWTPYERPWAVRVHAAWRRSPVKYNEDSDDREFESLMLDSHVEAVPEESRINWAQCDKCDKWRIMPDVPTGAFECSMIGGCVSCGTAEDEEPVEPSATRQYLRKKLAQGKRIQDPVSTCA